MKKFKARFLKMINFLIAGLISYFGFSCDDKFAVAEYGTPSATFKVDGKVTSLESNEAIPGIQVTMFNDTSFAMRYDTAYSNNQGVFNVSDDWGFPTDKTYIIKFKDIDGSLNGTYQELDTNIEFKNSEFTGGDGHWYEGKTSKTLNVKLKPE